MSNTMALGGPDQQAGYMQAGYQSSMAADMSGTKAQGTVGGMPQPSNGLDKGDAKDGQQQGHGGWANSMEQAYYKGGTPGHGHPGNYYGAHMAPPHHPYMWGAQQMMPPYGSAPHSHYGYGAMYAPQHPAMSSPHPTAAYGYSQAPQGQGKDGLMVPAGAPPSAQAMSASLPASGGHDQGNTEDSSEEEDMRRGKRGYDTLNSAETGVQIATPANGNASGQYPYNPDMWAMGAPVQRGQGNPGLPGEGAPLPYQDEREIKRQRRKQSNRESARRSRLRKQAECEDLGIKVSSLSSENVALRKQLAELQERCGALTNENSRLREQALAAGATEEPPTAELDPASEQQFPESASAPEVEAEEDNRRGEAEVEEGRAEASDALAGKLLEISQDDSEGREGAEKDE